MIVSIEAVKELRNRTSAGILDCNQALLEVGGDIEKAIELLRERGVATAEKKKDAVATEGVIEAYVHHTKHIGALVELNCETDFVAHTDEFKELARNLAMQIAAASPQFIASEDMPPEAEMDPQVVCLLSQPFIKDPSRTVKDVVTETIAKVGENIKVRRFARFELGVDH
ncbi:MAG: translation elongation factor Ts [Dehalococcoidia bacterium]|jgi:elongation factor Ts